VSNTGRLTPKQARYVEARLLGDKPQVAYAKAFPGATKGTLKRKPYELERNPRVLVALRAVRERNVKLAMEMAGTDSAGVLAAGVLAREVVEAGLTRAEKRRILKRIAMDRKAARLDRMRAIQIDNLMTGDNKPVRFEGEITLHGIFQALKSTTALPVAEEVIELDPNGPMAALR